MLLGSSGRSTPRAGPKAATAAALDCGEQVPTVDADVTLETPAGDEAVALHAPGLKAAARVVLAAVDGKRSTATLKARFGALMPVASMLERLARGGYFESALAGPSPGAKAPEPTTAEATTAAASVPAPTFDLAVARRTAVRGHTETQGPGGGMLALQVERRRTHPDFVALRAKALGRVRAQRGEEAAAIFLHGSPAPPAA